LKYGKAVASIVSFCLDYYIKTAKITDFSKEEVFSKPLVKIFIIPLLY